MRTLLLTAAVTAIVAAPLGVGASPFATAQTCSAPRVSVSATDQYEGSGGGTTPFAFTVRVAPVEDGCSAAGSVRYRTADGDAEAEHDYTPTSGTISWKTAGSHEIVVPVRRDFEPEYDEEFKVELYEPRHAVLSDSSATAAVFNDDKLVEKDFPGVETWVATGGICWWPNDVYLKLPLWVNVTPRAPITVQLYAKDGTAVAGKHYELGTSAVTFTEDADRVTLPIKILAGPGKGDKELFFYVVIKDVSAGVAINKVAKVRILQG